MLSTPSPIVACNLSSHRYIYPGTATSPGRTGLAVEDDRLNLTLDRLLTTRNQTHGTRIWYSKRGSGILSRVLFCLVPPLPGHCQPLYRTLVEELPFFGFFAGANERREEEASHGHPPEEQQIAHGNRPQSSRSEIQSSSLSGFADPSDHWPGGCEHEPLGIKARGDVVVDPDG